MRALADARSGLEIPAGTLASEVAAVLEHELVPFVSYPYEWTFGMLRDAALLQLELVRRSIGAGMILKDSSPYNVQFHGARPLFIDVGSFESLREGEPWAGYRQFCMLFLYLLESWKGVPFQPWLRGSLAGITPETFRSCSLGATSCAAARSRTSPSTPGSSAAIRRTRGRSRGTCARRASGRS